MNLPLLLFVPINRLTLMACFAAAAGLYFLFDGLRLFARRRSLEHTPASTVSAASVGPSAVSGVATGPYTLSAPVSGQPCFVYHTTAWQQSGSRRNQQWTKVAEETLHLPFFVQDSTGQLLVEPLGADLDLHRNLRQEYGLALSSYSEGSIPPRVSVFLARHGIALGRPTRIEERSLQPDMPVFIAGTVTQNPGIQLRPYSPPGGDPRTDSPARAINGTLAESASRPEVIRLSTGPATASTAAMSQQSKIAAALNRAGITKPEAWAAAGVPYEDASPEGVAVEERTQLFAEEAPESPAGAVNNQAITDAAPRLNLAPRLVLMKGAENPLFMISCHSQPELEHSFAWQSVAMVAGGAVLSLLGLYVLLLMRHTH